jgi:hypothetical protein
MANIRDVIPFPRTPGSAEFCPPPRFRPDHRDFRHCRRILSFQKSLSHRACHWPMLKYADYG